MPDGWAEMTLGEVAEVNPETTKGMSPQRRIRYIDLSAVSADSGIEESAVIEYELHSAPGRARRVVRHGDVLVSTVRPYLRGFAVVPEQLDGAVASTGFTVLRAREGLSLPGFVWSTVSKADFADRLMERATGSNYPAVRPNDIGEQVVLLPPLVVQRRVVDLVDAVDTYAAAAAERAEAARDARSALLEQLLMAGGDEWIGTTLGEVADYQNGYPFKPAELGGDGLPVIRIKQLLDARETPDRASIAVPERHRIADGDLVFSWSGTLAVRIWSRGPAALNQHLFRVSERPGVERRWLALALDHAIAELNEKTHGSTMRHITKANLLPHPVLLPPLPEQVRIVDLVNAAESEAERAAQAEAAALSLRSALLGELLSGDREVPESYDELVGLVA